MARVGFSIEKLLEIVGENSDSGVQILFGSGAPGGDAGEQDASPIGSLYLDTSTGHSYKKDANAGAAADWFRDGKLSAAYAAAGGDPAAGDSLEEAIAKIDDNLDDLTTTVGVSQGDTDMGTYTGNIVGDNGSVKQNIQDLETYIENNVVEDNSGTGITTETVIDDELVDNVLAVEYMCVISLNSAPARRRTVLITISHDGTASADATETDDSVFSKLKHGASFDYTLSTGVSGTGGTQVMELKLASVEVGGVDYNIRKIGQVLA